MPSQYNWAQLVAKIEGGVGEGFRQAKRKNEEDSGQESKGLEDMFLPSSRIPPSNETQR